MLLWALMLGWAVQLVLQGAVLSMLFIFRTALPCLAAYLLVQTLQGIVLYVVSLTLPNTGWYNVIYYGSEPGILALLAVAAIEAIGPVTPKAACASALCVIAALAASQGAPTAMRLAVLSSVALALVVSVAVQYRPHPTLMALFILVEVYCTLTILMGERNSLKPGTVLVWAQLAPLTGWLLWADRLVEPVKLLRRMRP